MTAEVPGVNDAGNLLAAGNIFDAHVVGLGLEDEPVHGVALGGGQAPNVVGRQSDGVALPLRGQRLAIGGKLAANPVRVRRQEGCAQPIAQITELVVAHVQHVLGNAQIGRSQHVYIRPCRESWP